MARNMMILALLAIGYATSGCSGGFTTPVISGSSTESSTLSNLNASFKAGGLSDSEAQAIQNSIQNDVAVSSSELSAADVNSSSSSYSADKIPAMIRAAMKALGNTAFTTDARKNLAIQLISKQIFLLFKDELKGLTTEKLEALVKSAVEEQVKASSFAGLAGTARDQAFTDIVSQSIAASEQFCGTDEKQTAVVRSLANGSIGLLGQAGMTAAEVAATVPKIVAAGIQGVQNMTAAGASAKSDFQLEFILRAMDNLGSSGVSNTDLPSVSANISTVVNAAISTTSIRDQVTVVKNETVACSSSAKFAYMYEYSDSLCQNLSKQYVMGPIQNSPLNKGFPNHAFCYLDPSTNKYYNWIGLAAGCNSQPPAVATIPTVRPSPRNLPQTFLPNDCAIAYSSGAAGGSDGGSQAMCESNALLNYQNNATTLLQIKYGGKIVATFDKKPTGLVAPNLSKMCGLADGSSGITMHDFYVRDANECLDHCVEVIAEFPQYSYSCKLDGSVIKTYAANTVPAKTTVTATAALAFTLPSTISEGKCLPVGVRLQNLGNVVQNGLNQAVSLYQSRQNLSSNQGSPVIFYVNSSCTVPVSVPTLASGASDKIFYVNIDAAATSVDFIAKSNRADINAATLSSQPVQ